MLNLEQTKSLFDKEAILFFNCNVISKKRAEELLGTDAVKAAIQFGQGGQDYNSFCGKKLELSYLYFSGFKIAVTYANFRELCEKGEAEVEEN